MSGFPWPMIMKAYTDLVQSKKLAEILPPNSADMYYSYDDHFTVNPTEKDYSVEIGKLPINADSYLIPCWSLAALLDLLPEGTNISKPTPLDNSEYCCWNQYDEVYADNPVDACYEMIVKFK